MFSINKRNTEKSDENRENNKKSISYGEERKDVDEERRRKKGRKDEMKEQYLEIFLTQKT